MKYSIIIATYNAEQYLERALRSVTCQTYPNVEIVVQDGGSTDGTLSILRKYDQYVNWQSEPDAGVYDAWNKALDRATGDWAIFLGSDDLLLNEDVLVKCHRHIRRLPSHVLFAYGAMARGENSQIEELVNRSLLEVYRRFIADMPIFFSATFVKLALAKKYRFDTSYKIAGDFDFAARFLKDDNIARIPVAISFMERGGLSTNRNTLCKMFDERGRVLNERVYPKAQEIVKACMQYYWDEDVSLEG